jgi:hypothetical protein
MIIMVTLHQVLCILIIILCRILLGMKNVVDTFVEKIKTHILCSITLRWKSCRLKVNVEKYGRALVIQNASNMLDN